MDICYRYRNDNRLITHIDIHRFDRISSPRKKRRKESNHPVLEKFPLLLFPRTTIKLRAKFRRERGGGEINRKKSRNETNRAKAFHFSKISPVVVINYHRVLHRYRIKIRETIPETRDRWNNLKGPLELEIILTIQWLNVVHRSFDPREFLRVLTREEAKRVSMFY